MACIITMFAVSTVFMTQPIFPEIAETFGISMVHARFAFSVPSFLYALAFLIIGPSTDLFNLPRMAVTGLVLLGGVLFFSSYNTSFTGFIVAMGVSGFLAALIPSSMYPYISHLAPDDKRGFYIGAVIAAATTGILVGRIVIGGLTGVVGWQSALKLYAVILLILALLSIMSFDTPKKKKSENNSFSSHYLDALCILKRKDVLVLYMIGFLIFFGFIGMVTFLTYRLSAPPFGYASQEIGWISFAGVTALIAPFSGELSKKTGVFRIILPGLFICIIALQLSGWFTSVIAIILGLLMLFFGVYSCQPLIFLLLTNRIPTSKIGFASSFYILSCFGGGSVATVILGPIWNRFGWEGITIACSMSLGAAFLLSLREMFKVQ